MACFTFDLEMVNGKWKKSTQMNFYFLAGSDCHKMGEK